MGILYDLLEGKIERPGINVVETNNGKAIVFENANAMDNLDSETLEELFEWSGYASVINDSDNEDQYARWGLDDNGEPIIIDD